MAEEAYNNEIHDVASRLVALVGTPRDDAVVNSIIDRLNDVDNPRTSTKDKEIDETIERLFDTRKENKQVVKAEFERLLANAPQGGRKSRKSKKTRKTRTRKNRKYSRRR